MKCTAVIPNSRHRFIIPAPQGSLLLAADCVSITPDPTCVTLLLLGAAVKETDGNDGCPHLGTQEEITAWPLCVTSCEQILLLFP